MSQINYWYYSTHSTTMYSWNKWQPYYATNPSFSKPNPVVRDDSEPSRWD